MANTVSDLAAPLPAQSRPLLAIGVGGVIVGALDLIYAILVYTPKQPILVPQTIASGILGERSYSGGIQTAAMGVALHFLIAFGAASVYYLASRRLAFLVQHAIVFGMIYGALVYLFMHIIVVPLSAASPGNAPLIYRVCEFVEHCFCVGLPISLSVRHYSH
jgi:hypothetical protein